jgi:hypothetical protein
MGIWALLSLSCHVCMHKRMGIRCPLWQDDVRCSCTLECMHASGSGSIPGSCAGAEVVYKAKFAQRM